MILGRESILLVDPLIAPACARRLEAALRDVSPLPIRFVVLTHHHTDHALGAGYFAAGGSVVLAHRACRDRMAAEHPRLIEERRKRPDIAGLFADAEAFLPAVVFEKDLSVDLGGIEARILHPGHGHTCGDAVVQVPEESVAICGDLVSSGYHVNYEDAAAANLEPGLRVLRELGARTFVPGHGEPGGVEILDRQAAYHAAVRDAVREGGGAAGVEERLRRAFPRHLLPEVIPAALRAWSQAPR